MLGKAGYLTSAATSFEEGRRLLLAPPAFDVLVTDVRLGRFNGLQLVVLRPATTAAIVITGHWDRTLEAEAQRNGAAYLTKPLTAHVLLETVKHVLAERLARGV
jgi:DNA-binding NtrC family response regulator